jgi:hypothetical protein
VQRVVQSTDRLLNLSSTVPKNLMPLFLKCYNDEEHAFHVLHVCGGLTGVEHHHMMTNNGSESGIS